MNTSTTVRDLLQNVAKRAGNYLDEAGQRRVAPTPEAVAALTQFTTTLPDRGQPAADILAQLDEFGSPASTITVGPRYFGFVTGGATPAALAANWLAATWDQNSALHASAPATAMLEQTALDWLIDLFGLPQDCGGCFVTGATVANFTVLAAARHRVLAQAGWDVEADGLFGAPSIDVLIGAESHPSVFKALGLLGLGRERVIKVAVDEQGRMRADALPKISGPTIVVTQVGNVNTGTSDPVGDICDRVANTGAWVHVDGAFGLWAAACPSLNHLVAGVERADSWATDAHKWLNVPYDNGIGIVRDPQALKAAMAVTAAYLPTAGELRNPSDYTPELSRRARGVDVWAALLALGRDGVADLVLRCCEHAREFARLLHAEGFEILNDVELNQVMVSFGDDKRTRDVIAAVQREGTCWAGVTHWQGKTAMRISVSNWTTDVADVQHSVDAITRAAQSL
ncbi:MAG: aspartate aminotransferase family protein [Gammaproteobacteria bacterium]